MTGTLVMLHGMTGTAEKMLPLAKQLVPEGWQIYCPQAKIPHPTRGGYAWWLRKNNTSTINYIDQAYESLSNVIEELPEGPLIVGGFSQGGAIASMMLERSIQDRIVGLVLIGTMSINPIGLKSAISNTWQRHVVWMHGENDKKIPISIGKEHIRIFDDAGWKVIKLQHKKGHMVDISNLKLLAKTIDIMSKTIM